MDRKKKFRVDKIKKLKKENPFFLPYAKNIDSLNNIYVTTKLARQGLVTLREELKSNDPFKFEIEIPAANGMEITKEKNKSKIVEILKSSIRSELFINSLVSSISLTENYLEEIIRIVLQKHPGKLSVDIDSKTKKEAQEEKKVDFKDVLSATSLDDLYNQIINQKLHKLFYASPADYFKYLGSIIQIKLDEDLIADYIEVKATRDLLVHNKGKVNQIYVEKAGIKARATDTRQNIPVNEEYFLNAMGTLKKIVRDSYESASKEYLKITAKKDLYPPII
ncbi:hypothetical protein [Cyclobacterium xiamenense]|uniref:hypothetical protein n=1 Tax=Cyclobacterium xiamenense TaxID=1297121 RepID=UPI0035D11108